MYGIVLQGKGRESFIACITWHWDCMKTGKYYAIAVAFQITARFASSDYKAL